MKYSYGTGKAGQEIIRDVRAASNELCILMYFLQLNDFIKVIKRITINNVISLNIYDNASFSSKLIVSVIERKSPG
jgi:hypothetical protein